jgi:endonuclease YncB( thermonuclease family)
VTYPPPAAPNGHHQLRQLLGTLAGLAVLVVAALVLIWWKHGAIDNSGSGGHNRPGGHQIGRTVTAPVGVPDQAQQLVVADAVDGDRLDATPVSAGVPIATTGRVRIRLIGVIAPDIQAPGGSPACFAKDARRALGQLAPAGTAIWVIADTRLIDDNAEYLVYVWNHAGTFVNLALADGGFVRSEAMNPDLARQPAIDEAISGAKTARRGLWGACAGR